MPIHIDAPVPGVLFDPANFTIRGWLWLEGDHAGIGSVEALDHDSGILLGSAEASTFHPRPDVCAKYSLPPETATAFEFRASHPTARVREPFMLSIRGRRRDGSPTPVLFTRLLAPPPPERHPQQMLVTRTAPDALGLEIGAHTNPVPGLTPFYTDAVAAFAGSAGRVDFLSDARALPLAADTLDYLISSHVLEHLADPIATLHEWHRVLRPGGLLYLVVPDQRYTFDEPRATTTTEHLLRDFNEGTTPADAAAHVDEFVYQTDWSMLSPNTAPADRASEQAAARTRYLRDLENGLPIDIHYHTFTPESLEAHLRAAGFIGGHAARFTIAAQAERYPPGRDDGIALLLEKTGPSATARRATTFTLGRLALVCPVTLEPLAPADGALVSAASRLAYPLVGGRPNLLPAPNSRPARPWGDRGWRAAAPAATLAGAATMPVFSVRTHLDEPAPGTVVDPLCFHLRGWVHLGEPHAHLAAVEAWSGETLIGETSGLYERADVTVAHWLAAGTRTGFEIFAHHPAAAPGKSFPVTIRARLTGGTRSPVVFATQVTALARDYRTNHFGILLDRRTTAVQREQNIFATGPSQAEGSPELAALLRRYLGAPPCRVIDVGCGLGSYGRGLLADGYDWLGVEIDAADCAELARLELPHRQVDGRTLPFADDAFDAALCLEVLEHIDEPRAFLAEIRRVAPRRLIVSVPNCELLGYLWDHLATPWHMLESTHVNYFTRWSLDALLREFYPRVELRFHQPYPLRTVEGTPLHYNLLAVATSA